MSSTTEDNSPRAEVFAGCRGEVVAMTRSGSQAWRRALKGAGSGTTTVCPSSSGGRGRLFAWCGGHMFCLSLEDGEVAWRVRPRPEAEGGCACLLPVDSDSGRSILVGSRDSVLCLGRDDGRMKWHQALRGSSAEFSVALALVHKAEGGAGIKSPEPSTSEVSPRPSSCAGATGDARQLVVAGTNHEVVAMDLESGVEAWRWSDGTLLSPRGYGGVSLVQHHDVLLVGVVGFVFKLTPDGRAVSKTNLLGTGYNPVSLLLVHQEEDKAGSPRQQAEKQRDVLLAGTNSGLFALDPETCSGLWKTDLHAPGSCVSVVDLGTRGSLAVGVAGTVVLVSKCGDRPTKVVSLPGCRGREHVGLLVLNGNPQGLPPSGAPTVLLACSSNKVHGLSPDGELLWSQGIRKGRGMSGLVSSFSSSSLVTLATLTRHLDVHSCPVLSERDVCNNK